MISRGEYGAVDGLPRILRLLDKHQVPASFFIPAVSAALHPQMIKEIQAPDRHEIGVHGWIHERLPSLNDEHEEQRLLTQSIELLTKVMGKRPVGYRAPSWQFSFWTMKQVKDAGFLYDSSLMASDDAYELLLDGQPTGVVELPIERILDDFPYFGGGANGSDPVARDVFEVFQSEFDVAYEERGLYILTMHPHIMGHRSRVGAARAADSAHEVEARRVVRHARTDRAAREDADVAGRAHFRCYPRWHASNARPRGSGLRLRRSAPWMKQRTCVSFRSRSSGRPLCSIGSRADTPGPREKEEKLEAIRPRA